MDQAGTSNIKEEEMESVSVNRDIPEYQFVETPQASMDEQNSKPSQKNMEEKEAGETIELILREWHLSTSCKKRS